MSVELQKVIDVNEHQMRRFNESALVKLIRRPTISEEEKTRILGYLQPWSDTFQRVITLRVACETDSSLQTLAQQHLTEELNHNMMLAQTRTDERGGIWDPVIAAAASWFIDQMLTLSGVERAVLTHLVLEGSGLVFHQAGCTTYSDNGYFALHSEADLEHLEMGYQLLKERTDDWRVNEVVQLLNRGWEMITLLCDRIAYSAIRERDDSPARLAHTLVAS